MKTQWKGRNIKQEAISLYNRKAGAPGRLSRLGVWLQLGS